MILVDHLKSLFQSTLASPAVQEQLLNDISAEINGQIQANCDLDSTTNRRELFSPQYRELSDMSLDASDLRKLKSVTKFERFHQVKNFLKNYVFTFLEQAPWSGVESFFNINPALADLVQLHIIEPLKHAYNSFNKGTGQIGTLVADTMSRISSRFWLDAVKDHDKRKEGTSDTDEELSKLLDISESVQFNNFILDDSKLEGAFIDNLREKLVGIINEATDPREADNLISLAQSTQSLKANNELAAELWSLLDAEKCKGDSLRAEKLLEILDKSSPRSTKLPLTDMLDSLDCPPQHPAYSPLYDQVDKVVTARIYARSFAPKDLREILERVNGSLGSNNLFTTSLLHETLTAATNKSFRDPLDPKPKKNEDIYREAELLVEQLEQKLLDSSSKLSTKKFCLAMLSGLNIKAKKMQSIMESDAVKYSSELKHLARAIYYNLAYKEADGLAKKQVIKNKVRTFLNFLKDQYPKSTRLEIMSCMPCLAIEEILETMDNPNLCSDYQDILYEVDPREAIAEFNQIEDFADQEMSVEKRQALTGTLLFYIYNPFQFRSPEASWFRTEELLTYLPVKVSQADLDYDDLEAALDLLIKIKPDATKLDKVLPADQRIASALYRLASSKKEMTQKQGQEILDYLQKSHFMPGNLAA